MGCSASRLSKTRSGTVSSLFLLAGMAGLSLAAPIPPLALPGGKQGIARLGNSGRENVLAADVDFLASNLAEPLIKADRILQGKLAHAADAKQFKVAKHGRTYGDQIL